MDDSRAPLRVLLVEDNPLDAELVVRELQRSALEVELQRVETEHAYRDAAATFRPDVILADYHLPRFSGTEALRIARAEFPEVPFIFVSGSIGEERAVEALHEGAVDYVMKDRPARLATAIRRALAEAEQRRLKQIAEEKLRASELRFRSLAETASEGVVMFGEGADIIYFNPAAASILGYASDEVVGKSVAVLLPQRYRRGWDETAVRFTSGDTRLRIGRTRVIEACRKDGSEFPAEVSVSSWSAAGSTYFTAFFRDVTERVAAEFRQRIELAVTRALSVAVTADDAVERILENVGQEFGWRTGTWWVPESSGRLLKPAKIWQAHDFTHQGFIDATRRLGYQIGEGLAGSVWSTRRAAIVTESVSEGSDPRVDAAADARLKLAVAFPVIQSNAVIGVFDFFSARTGAATIPLIEVLQNIGHRIGEFFARRTAEDLLQRSELSLGEAQRIAQLGSWTYDVGADRVVWSAEAKRIFGLRDDQEILSNDDYYARVHPDDREHVRMLTTAPYAAIGLDFRHRVVVHGETRTVHCRVRVVEGTPQEPRVVLGTVQDVTEQVRAQEMIESLSTRSELILRSAAEGIIGSDASRGVNFANPAALEMTGYSAAEILSARNIHNLLHHSRPDGSPYPDAECPIAMTLIDGVVRKGEDTYWRKSGQPFPVEYSAAPVKQGGAIVGVVTIFQDVSERRRLETQLERSNRVESLGRMAATLAHEFNNVLMGIQPFAEVIKRSAPNEKRVQDAASHILNSVGRGRRVTAEILRFTQGVRPALQEQDVALWIEKLRPELEVLAGTDVSLKVNVPSHPVVARFDPVQFQQVITNLIVNARDASAHGAEIVISIAGPGDAHPRSAGEIPPDRILISVCDSGAGIAPEDLDRIFEPLFTTKRTGTGLGLPVVQRVVSEHGGSVSVVSSPGRGSEFHVFLPRGAIAVRAPAGDADTGGRHVLLVEDEHEVAAGIEALLSDEGFEVRIVGEAAHVIAVAERFKPDVVVLDLSLPDGSGADVYRDLAARWPQLPVVFSSGHADEGDLAPFLNSPGVVYLRKPYDLAALLEMIERVTRGG